MQSGTSVPISELRWLAGLGLEAPGIASGERNVPGRESLDGQAIRDAVPMADLLDAIDAAFRDVAAGRDRSPVRTRLEMGNGDLLLMPGLRAGGRGAAVKLVTVMPGNADRGLPTVQAVVLWFDAGSGEPLAILDGTTVTAMQPAVLQPP